MIAAYTIIQTQEYIEQFNEIIKRFPKAAALNDAIIYALQRYPRGFDNLVQNFYHWVTDELASSDFPVVKIIFRVFDQKSEVVILSIEEV